MVFAIMKLGKKELWPKFKGPGELLQLPSIVQRTYVHVNHEDQYLIFRFTLES